MKAFVIMGNDYPESVFADKDAADNYVKSKMDDEREEHERKNPGGFYSPRIYWRSYEFEIIV